MADFLGMMKQAAQLQSKMQAMQEELGNVEVEGTSGGGMVAVRMTAKMEVKGVRIDPSLMKAEEREILEDLLVTAHNDARRKAEVYAQASSLQLRRVEWITEDAGFAPPGPMRAQGASVPMAVSVPIATGEETLRVRVTVGFDIAD